MSGMIRATGLVKRYRDVVAVSGLDLTVGEGRVLGVGAHAGGPPALRQPPVGHASARRMVDAAPAAYTVFWGALIMILFVPLSVRQYARATPK